MVLELQAAGGRRVRRHTLQTLKRYAPLIVLVAVVIVALASGVGRDLNLDTLQRHETELRAFVSRNLALGVLAFILIYAAVVAVSLPGALVLTLTGGFLFGPWLGGGATVVGATIGAVIVFLIVRTSLGAALRERARASGGNLKSVMDGIRTGAFGYVLTLRLIPIAPFWLVNVAAALADAPLRPYTLATLIGIMPATFIYSGVGAGLGQVIAQGGRPNLGIIFEPYVLGPLLGLAVLSLGGTWLQRRMASRKSEP